MKVSIIIPTYKDITALKLILDALQYQTYNNFEIIIAEDDNLQDTKIFLKNYNSKYSIKHFYHKNKGNRKAIILNKALAQIKTDYVIFIDGDTIPYSTFIESHIKLSKPKTILCGRRVNLGDKVSNDLRNKKITAYEIEKNYFKLYKYLTNDNIRHYEQGIYLKPNSILQKIISSFDKNIHILGSNFSCYYKDIYEINGFDEEIVGGMKDDVDLEWRFITNGCRLKSVKFCANLLHLNHSRSDRTNEEKIAKEQIKIKKQNKEYIAKKGIKQYE